MGKKLTLTTITRYGCYVTMQTRGQLLQRKDKSTKGTGPLSKKARSPRKKLVVLLAERKTKKAGMSLFLQTPASHAITPVSQGL